MTRAIKIFGFIATILAVVTSIFIVFDRYFGDPPDISGKWEIKFNIEESSFIPYKGRSMTFKLFFIQVKNEIEAKGEKWRIDNKEIPFGQHDPIDVKGTIQGNKLYCTYTLKGTKRTTVGNIEAIILENSQTLNGKFSGTAADMKGSVIGMKNK